MRWRVWRLRKHGYCVSLIEELIGAYFCKLEKNDVTERFISRESDMDALKKAYKSVFK